MIDARTLIALVESGQITIEPEALKLKVGILEVDVSATGYGKIAVDGHVLPARGLDLHLRVGQIAQVVLDVVPVTGKKGS
jgi:hypothetical protein